MMRSTFTTTRHAEMHPAAFGGGLRASIERPVSEAPWLVPAEVEVRDGWLYWRNWREWDGAVELGTNRPDDRKVLTSFVQLAEAGREDRAGRIRGFARTFGVLGLCEAHGNPPATCGGCPTSPAWLELAPSQGRERLRHWLRWAQRARALLRTSAALHRSEEPNPEDWSKLLAMHDAAGWLVDQSAGELRDVVGGIVDDWLRRARLSVRFRWDKEQPDIELASADAFGAVGRQLAFALARVDGFATCAGCGTPFVPDRRPRQGERSWCAECKKRSVPEKIRQAEYRSRREKGSAR